MNAHVDQNRKRLARLLSDMSPPAFDGGNPEIGQRVFNARSAFLRGFREALNASPEKLPQLLQNEPSERLGFALEGAAMALTLMDEFSFASRRLLRILLDSRSAEEHTLSAIGVGWASARLRKPLDWLPMTLNSRYMSAVADGYGFHQGFFHSHRFTSRGFPTRKGELSTSYDIGLGRALWFIHIGNVKPIEHTIDKFLPDRRKHLWRGVGTACAFTGNTEYGAVRMGAAASRFQSHFRAGLKTGTQLLHALAQQKEVIS